MLVVNALKTVCDLLLCFTFAALIGPYSESWLLMGVVLALGFLSTLILQKTDGSLLARILCGLLPALGLYADGYYFWDPVHAFSAKLLLALIIVHIVVHWRWIFSFSALQGKCHRL